MLVTSNDDIGEYETPIRPKYAVKRLKPRKTDLL